MYANFLSLKEAILQEVKNVDQRISILDIGCNDGLLLSMFKELTCFTLYGTDPSPIALKASSGNYTLHSEYFPGPKTKAAGPYDIIIGTNSLAHIPDIGKCFKEIKEILADDGILVIEVSDFEQMARKGAWDYIYHEHLYYYTKSSLTLILSEHGLDVYRIDDIGTKGGSIRVFAKKSSCHMPSSRLESEMQCPAIATLKRKYRESIESYTTLARGLASSPKLYGYGACATGSVTISQHQIFRSLESIIDDNVNRQGLFAPHWGVPVIPLNDVSFAPDDIVIVFAWRFIEQIREKILNYCNSNDLPVPIIVKSINS